MIGDNLTKDIKGASEIGITTILKNKANLKKTNPAKHVINNFGEITKIFVESEDETIELEFNEITKAKTYFEW